MKKIIVGMFVMLLLNVNVQLSAANVEKIKNIEIIEQTDTSIRVQIDTSAEVKYSVFRVSNPSRVVVEIVNAENISSEKEITVESNIIKRIRTGQFKETPVKITRIVLDMKVEDYEYKEVYVNNKITLILELGPSEIKKHAKTIKKKKSVVTKKSKMKSLPRNIPTEEQNQNIEEILKSYKKRNLQSVTPKEIVKAEVEDYNSGDIWLPTSNELVDFNFKQADVREVLKAFELKLDRNIVPTPDVTGKVTLRLKQVPFDEAFSIFLDHTNLLAIKKSDNIIEVFTAASMPLIRKTFTLGYLNATEMSTSLKNTLTSAEAAITTISVDLQTNALMVNSTKEVLEKIEKIIESLDNKSPQIMIRARLIEINLANEFSSGISMYNNFATNLNSNGDGITDITQFKDFSNYEFEGEETPLDYTDDRIVRTLSGTGLSAVIQGSFSGHSIDAIVNYLATNSNGKTISEPTIMTENNKSAQIHIGKNLPVQTLTITDSGTTQTVTYITEGIDLIVTPSVPTGSKNISLKVNVSVSELVSFQADNPVTSERSAETEITLRSGTTVVIGGLISESNVSSQTGIPLLKDLPLIGFLFTNKNKVKDRTELLIFISPEIL